MCACACVPVTVNSQGCYGYGYPWIYAWIYPCVDIRHRLPYGYVHGYFFTYFNQLIVAALLATQFQFFLMLTAVITCHDDMHVCLSTCTCI